MRIGLLKAILATFGSLLLATYVKAGEIPVELSRWNPAGLGLEWKYERIAFLASAQESNDNPSSPVYRLHHQGRGYFYTVSDVEVRAAEKAGFVKEGIAFYAPRKGSLKIHRFQNRGNATYYYADTPPASDLGVWVDEGVAFAAYPGTRINAAKETSDDIQKQALVPVYLYKIESRNISLLTSGAESPYIVGAFYFGSFSPSATSIIGGTERVHKRQGDWWGGVDDFYGKEPGIPIDTRGWSGEWSFLKPVIGYYDQSKAETLEKHIKQAHDAGLSFFSFYWYWSNKKKGELYPEALASFFAARNNQLLKFNLSFYAHPWDPDMAIAPSQVDQVVKMIVKYFKATNYLKLADGRPVFVIGDNRNLLGKSGELCKDEGCALEATGRFLTALSEETKRQIGTSPYVEIQAGASYWGKITQVQGITCLTPPFVIGSGTDFPEFKADIFRQLVETEKLVSPCMLENFDERPRQDVLIGDRNAVFYLKGRTEQKFRKDLEVAKHLVDENIMNGKGDAGRIVYLYAWNEWHEGGILEPNVEYGSRELNVVTDVFQLPRMFSECLDRGKC